ncbi:MAG: hypothetical protein WC100_12600 [Sterolibacterium sp.]
MKNAGWWVAAMFGMVIALAVFAAYQQPGLLLNFLNLRYCG